MFEKLIWISLIIVVVTLVYLYATFDKYVWPFVVCMTVLGIMHMVICYKILYL